MDDEKRIESLASAITAPDDPNIKIWRYMDFAQFVSMPKGGGLFFAQADKLGDPFEDSYPQESIRRRADTIYSNPWYERTPELDREFFERIRARILISFWHMNKYESAVM